MRNRVNGNNLETSSVEEEFETDRLNLHEDNTEEAERDRNTPDSAQRNLNSSILETRTIDEEEIAA